MTQRIVGEPLEVILKHHPNLLRPGEYKGIIKEAAFGVSKARLIPYVKLKTALLDTGLPNKHVFIILSNGHRGIFMHSCWMLGVDPADANDLEVWTLNPIPNRVKVEVVDIHEGSFYNRAHFIGQDDLAQKLGTQHILADKGPEEDTHAYLRDDSPVESRERGRESNQDRHQGLRGVLGRLRSRFNDAR